jgi:hypothetical protein
LGEPFVAVYLPGIGSVKALSLIKKHGTIEEVLAALDTEKYPVPEPYPVEEARKLFKGAHQCDLIVCWRVLAARPREPMRAPCVCDTRPKSLRCCRRRTCRR